MNEKSNFFTSLKRFLQAFDSSFASMTSAQEQQRMAILSELKRKEHQRACTLLDLRSINSIEEGPDTELLDAEIRRLELQLKNSKKQKEDAHEALPSKFGPSIEKARLELRLANLKNKIVDTQRKIDEEEYSLQLLTSASEQKQTVIATLQWKKRIYKKNLSKRGKIENLWKSFWGNSEETLLTLIEKEISEEKIRENINITKKESAKETLNTEKQNLISLQNESKMLYANLASCEKQIKEFYLESEKRRLENEHNMEEFLAENRYKRKSLITEYEQKLLEKSREKEKKLQSISSLENDITILKKSLDNCNSKIEQIILEKEQNRAKILSDIDLVCNNILREQPPLETCSCADFGKKTEYSNVIVYGKLCFCFKNERILLIPRVLPFPLNFSVHFGITPMERQQLTSLLMRIFQVVPLGQIFITAIDPIFLGKSLPNFQVLLKNRRPFPAQKILTRGDEIEEALNQHLLYVENLTQRVLVSGITSWDDYNKCNPKNQLPYKILIIFDLPEQLTEKSALYLTRLIDHGPRCGVLPLLSFNPDVLEPQKYKSLIEMIEKKSWNYAEFFKRSAMATTFQFLKTIEEPESPYPKERLDNLFSCLAERFAKASKFNGQMVDLWDTTAFWRDKAISGINANVGWTTEGNTPVKLSLGDMPSHVLLGGKTGSGKSNFIHILVHSLCHQYSPYELSLYLLDYKEGTEFNIYTSPLLPHARLVATESDVEYGLTVLRHLNDELQRRSDLFKEFGSPDYKDFREKNDIRLPRILLIIDEFQKLFDGDHNSAIEAEQLINNLLRQGRSFGIHLMLATQTIRGLQNQSIGQLISNLGCRIALSCSSEDSALLLGNANWAAATLQSPPEGIINSENGVKSANIHFNIPFASKEIRISKQKMFQREAHQQNIEIENKIFNGNSLPAIPPDSDFEKLCLSQFSLYLGLSHDFESKPFVVNIKHQNLLIAGYAPEVRAGLLSGIFKSIKTGCGKVISVLFYSSRENSNYENFLQGTMKDYTWDFSDFDAFVSNDNTDKLIVIDSFDFARKLHPSPLGSYRKPGASELPYDILKRCADVTTESKCHVILFVENYRRFANSAKDLFNLFDLRIGFGMNEDDAGHFVNSGGFGKLRGIENTNKAIYVNNLNNNLYMIRPFSKSQKQK